VRLFREKENLPQNKYLFGHCRMEGADVDNFHPVLFILLKE
jgi:hypothetical protein